MRLLVDFILIVGILLNILVLVGLIRLKEKNLPQKILILFWVFVLANILHSYSALHNIRWFNRTTFIFEDGSRFIVAPLIYLYYKSLFFKQTSFVKKNIFHFIPFLVYFIVYTIPRFVNIFTEPDLFTHLYPIYRYINLALVKDLFFIMYCVLSLKLFYSAKTKMKLHYSTIKEKDFFWLALFLWSMSAVITVDLIITLLEISFNYSVLWDDFITLTFLVIAMVILGFNGLKQSTIFLPYFLVDKQNKNAKNPLNLSNVSESLKLKIESTLKEKKLYLNAELTLRILAEELDISERKLSTFLNAEMRTTFYDLINSYRIEEAKILLISNEYSNYTMEGIGESCGFKSRSTFFRIFKRETDLSPSAFKKNHMK